MLLSFFVVFARKLAGNYFVEDLGDRDPFTLSLPSAKIREALIRFHFRVKN